MKYKSSKILYTSKGGHRGGGLIGLTGQTHKKSIYILDEGGKANLWVL